MSKMFVARLKIYKAPKIQKASAIAKSIGRKGKGHFSQPKSGEYFDIAAGEVRKKPRGRWNPASGYFEED